MPEKAITLDVRCLPPPEPFEHITAALRTLPDGTTLLVRIHREPFPLYDVLRESGYDWQTTPQPDGTYEIRITHKT